MSEQSVCLNDPRMLRFEQPSTITSVKGLSSTTMDDAPLLRPKTSDNSDDDDETGLTSILPHKNDSRVMPNLNSVV